MKPNLIVILGPTASGKTKLAACLAKDMGAEIISADSRQVYRGMDIGTGKDLDDYVVNGVSVPHYLIDIVDPDYEFNVFEYQCRFFQCFSEITERNVLPVMVGGTGLYIDAVLRRYRMPVVPEDSILRAEIEGEKTEALIKRLMAVNTATHNTTDILDRRRLIRAIEIAENSRTNGAGNQIDFPSLNPLIIGIRRDRSVIRQRITKRLRERLAAGMIEEVKKLHDKGICWERIDLFGLEYRYIGLFLQGKLNYDDMFRQLNTRIHQFAKRQETWFRRMERQGLLINWLDNPEYEGLKALVEALYK
jgi:tRNA dimethylallyltransferase